MSAREHIATRPLGFGEGRLGLTIRATNNPTLPPSYPTGDDARETGVPGEVWSSKKNLKNTPTDLLNDFVRAVLAPRNMAAYCLEGMGNEN